MEAYFCVPLLIYSLELLDLNGVHDEIQYFLLKIASLLEAYRKNFLPQLPSHIPIFYLLQNKSLQKYAVHKTTKSLLNPIGGKLILVLKEMTAIQLPKRVIQSRQRLEHSSNKYSYVLSFSHLYG